jgi:hypothetical protein
MKPQPLYRQPFHTLTVAESGAEGLDSIATISEQSEAEAIESKLEGGNKDAEK